MCITREVVHAFAANTPRDVVNRPFNTLGDVPVLRPFDIPPLSAADLLPFRALRIAQLQALGMDIAVATIMCELLPPAPSADAGAERLLLDAARFLLHIGFIPTSEVDTNAPYEALRAQRHAFREGLDRLRANGHVLADICFFLDAQLRAAEAPGKPLRDAFSFSGRTLASVTRIAAEHRREALVAAAVTSIRSDGGAHFHPDKLRGLWRAPLTWDAECERMLALRCPDAGLLRLGSALWPADVQLRGTAAAAGTDATILLHGEWHMQRLNDAIAIRVEGEEQYNCLRHGHGAYLSTSRLSSYWSLRFTPDVAGEALLKADEQLRRSAAQLRLTVELHDKRVSEARAPSNNMPPLAALQALAEWGRRAGVRVPQYKSSSNAR
jgi:hypothetical protein